MRLVSPQPRGAVPAEQARRLERAGKARTKADTELRAAVADALAAGGSVREVAALAGISTNTVARWKRESEGSSLPTGSGSPGR